MPTNITTASYNDNIPQLTKQLFPANTAIVIAEHGSQRREVQG
jgi:hypothetical protein